MIDRACTLEGHAGFIGVYLLATPIFVVADLAFAANLLLLMLSILLPIWNIPEAIMSGALEGPFDQMSLVNVVLSGSVLLYGYYRHQATALSGQGPEMWRWGR